MSDIWMVYSTFAGRDEAFSTAQELLKDRLIACANIMDGMTSLYRWENKVHQEKEVVMVTKTRVDLVEDVIRRIKEMHTYQLPCIVAWPLEKGYVGFREWILSETDGKKLE